jgi:hypothetical protein
VDSSTNPGKYSESNIWYSATLHIVGLPGPPGSHTHSTVVPTRSKSSRRAHLCTLQCGVSMGGDKEETDKEGAARNVLGGKGKCRVYRPISRYELALFFLCNAGDQILFRCWCIGLHELRQLHVSSATYVCRSASVEVHLIALLCMVGTLTVRVVHSLVCHCFVSHVRLPGSTVRSSAPVPSLIAYPVAMATTLLQETLHARSVQRDPSHSKPQDRPHAHCALRVSKLTPRYNSFPFSCSVFLMPVFLGTLSLP